MPLAAVNGITLAWTRLENPDNLRFILDLGGIIGNSLLVFVEGNEFLSRLVDLKSLFTGTSRIFDAECICSRTSTNF